MKQFIISLTLCFMGIYLTLTGHLDAGASFVVGGAVVYGLSK